MTRNQLMINYEKRKNSELFKSFQEKKNFSFSSLQNYSPIFNKFFSLTPSNYNSINLNNKHYIYNIDDSLEINDNLYKCSIKSIDSEKAMEKEVFLKFAPLIDPFKFLIGKYNINDKNLKADSYLSKPVEKNDLDLLFEKIKKDK